MKRRKSNKGFIILTILFVTLTALLGFISNGFTDWSIESWKDKVLPNLPSSEDDTSLIVSSEEELNSQLAPMQLNALITEGVYEVTATVQPVYATNKNITWTLDWANDASSTTDDDGWKSGKVASDYITVSASENTLVVTVELVAPFSSQLDLKAALTNTPEVNATVKIDYQKRLVHTYTAVQLMVGDSTAPFTNSSTFPVSLGTKPVVAGDVITYDYSPSFYWYGSAVTTPEPWTDTITVSRGEGTYEQSASLLPAVAAKLDTESRANFDFRLLFTGILSAQWASTNFLADFVYAIEQGNTPQAALNRSKGAGVYLGYKVLFNGVEVNTTATNKHDGWTLVKINTSVFTLEPQAMITLDESVIVF